MDNKDQDNYSIISTNPQMIIKYSSENIKRALSLAEDLEQSELAPRGKTWKCVHQITKHRDWVRSLALTPNKQILVSGSDDKTIRLWDIKTGTQIKAWLADSHKVNSLVITPDGNYIISAGSENTIKIWTMETGLLHSILSGHDYSIYCLAMSNDGKTIVSSSKDKTIKLWNWQNSLLLHSFEVGSVYSLAMSKDGSLLVAGHEDDSVLVFDLRAKTNIHRFEGNNFRSIIGTNCVAIDAQQEHLFSGHEDGSIRVWNLNDKTLIYEQKARGSIHTLTLTPNGKTLAVGGMGSLVNLWNLESMELELSLSEGDIFDPTRIFTLALSLDGLTLITGDSKKTINIWTQI